MAFPVRLVVGQPLSISTCADPSLDSSSRMICVATRIVLRSSLTFQWTRVFGIPSRSFSFERVTLLSGSGCCSKWHCRRQLTGLPKGLFPIRKKTAVDNNTDGKSFAVRNKFGPRSGTGRPRRQAR
jgi:hypothetical protein